MSLSKQVDADLVEALKKGETEKVSVLRLLKAEFINCEKEKGQKPKEDDLMAQVQRAAKNRKESIESYTEGGREELAEKEKRELEILAVYLPKQLSEEEITGQVEQVIKEQSASSLKDTGRVMGQAMKSLKGKADGKQVKQIVQKLLSS